ncbi:octopamine receptor [Biomphalaria pfeifferi]|uniref:Octopamine receptor n=1 Tax=Biomphalaria pfeifferi TaxID=112525 RepID=A0AAD8BUG0_BIOPF|nr:octopamine receptor [Biomphalaria pfeifferi]
MAKTELGETSNARGYFEIWASAVPMVAICVITIAANGAILTMFISRRGLRRCKNLYFFSLALSEFLIGLLEPYKLSNDLHMTWDSGWRCRIFQTTRQSLGYISFLSVFLITLDKWRATHYPVSYRSKATKCMTVVAVVSVWFIGILINSFSQIWWDDFLLSLNAVSVQSKVSSSSDNGMNSSPRPSVLLGQIDSASRDVQYSIGTGPFPYHHNICPEGYHLSFNLSIFSTTIFYIMPIIAMLVFDISLYLKIKWRKSVEVQRSTSVTDTYFMTLKKPALELPESCMNSHDVDPAKESLLKNSDNKPINKHLAIGARSERRHSSLPAISPIIKGRTSSGRRVSMPESNTGSGGCRYVGRKWSGCATALTNNQNAPPTPLANLAPRLHTEDMVHDILVKQDKTTVTCLWLMLGVLVTCWLPHAVVNMVNSRCWCLDSGALTATSWFFLLDHAANPILYGLMYVQFKNVLKQWLLVERMHAFKMRDTLILKNLQKKVSCEENSKDKSPNPSTKQQQFQVPKIASHVSLAHNDSDNTAL